MSAMLGASGFLPLSVIITPNPCTQTQATAPITVGPTIMNVTGGSGSFTYSWTYLDGDILSIDTPAAQSTTFTTGAMPFGSSKAGDYTGTVTDTITGLSASDTVGIVANRS